MADRALGSPGRLEGHARVGLVLLDAEPVVDVDGRAVAGMRSAVATIIRPHHVYAGIVEIAHRHAALRRVPRLVAEAYALAEGAARAGDPEGANWALFGQRKAPALAVRKTSPH